MSEEQTSYKVTDRRLFNPDCPACSMRMETRKRLSRGSSEVQVSHSQAMEGTPVDVPVPRKVSFMIESNVETECPMSNVQPPKSKVK